MFNFAKKQKNTLLPNKYSQYFNDFSAVCAFIISMLLVISLATYNSNDNCWSKVGNDEIYHNRLGKFGAYIADFLYYNIGYCSWLLAIIIFYFGYRKIIDRELSFASLSSMLRVIMSILLLVTGSILEYIYNNNNLLGQFLFDKLILNLGDLGLALITIVLFFISGFYFFDCSWQQSADLLGKMVFLISSKLHNQNIKKSNHKKNTLPQKVTNNQNQKKILKPVKLFNNNKSLPPLSLLQATPTNNSVIINNQEIEQVSQEIASFMHEFNIDVTVSAVQTGPVITRYEIMPPKGLKGSKIVELNKDIARSLSKESVRIVENIKGKNTMGLEIPNQNRQTIFAQEIFNSEEFNNSDSVLTLGLGKGASGEIVITDLAKMPHLLVAGTTGSGKSVAINAMILSILYKAEVKEVKFIMIDPKMVELTPYQDLPHLLMPVIINVEESVSALTWAVSEMERRYLIMSKLGVRHIKDYNQLWSNLKDKNSDHYHQLFNQNPDLLNEIIEQDPWPFIVIVIDELADLMDQVGKKIEKLIARLAQKARAIGIHLIIATQRPDATVVTGLIKANIPARISFQLRSETDYRIILGQSGGGSLLGSGDMLFLGPASSLLLRAHSSFVQETEINKVVKYIKENNEPVQYIELNSYDLDDEINGNNDYNLESKPKDALYNQVHEFIITSGGKKCSISSLQTAFGIGYNRAARIMNELEKQKIVRRNDKGGFEIC